MGLPSHSLLLLWWEQGGCKGGAGNYSPTNDNISFSRKLCSVASNMKMTTKLIRCPQSPALDQPFGGNTDFTMKKVSHLWHLVPQDIGKCAMGIEFKICSFLSQTDIPVFNRVGKIRELHFQSRKSGEKKDILKNQGKSGKS